MNRLLCLFVCLWLTCALLTGCTTPITTAQPLAAPTVVAPTATDDTFLTNICHTCDVHQRQMQATVTK